MLLINLKNKLKHFKISNAGWARMDIAVYTLVPSLDPSAQVTVGAQAASSSSPRTVRPASDSAGFSHSATTSAQHPVKIPAPLALKE